MTAQLMSRERLEEIVSDQMINQGSEFAMLARMALAAMDSEPVAEVCEDYAIRYISSGPAPKEGLYPGDKLYRHAQQSVVPDIDELRLAFEAAERESDDGFNLHKYGIGYADDETQGRWDAWLACRAAMLSGDK